MIKEFWRYFKWRIFHKKKEEGDIQHIFLSYETSDVMKLLIVLINTHGEVRLSPREMYRVNDTSLGIERYQDLVTREYVFKPTAR